MSMLSAVWDQFLAIVQEEAGSRVVDTWLKAVLLYQWDSLQKIVYLLAPNAFVKEWIRSNYLHLFEKHLSRLLNVDEIKIVLIDAQKNQQTENNTVNIIPAQRLTTTMQTWVKPTINKNRYQVNKNYLFDTFVKGPNNQMAYAAALAVTQKPGKLYNPFFIYGDSGLGKTHLLHAIANQLYEQSVRLDILYQPADRFVSEFINAIRFDKMHKFQAKYKNVDVFLVDDIQCISNKEQTQEAFFHIFNALYDAHKQIVFSSDSYPANINGLAERLRSRLEWGLVADIQVPSLETKMAIIKRKADLNKLVISDEVALLIASQVISNVRELEGALIRVSAYASLMNQSITPDLVKKVLGRTHEEKKETQAVDFDTVIQIVHKHYPYSLSQLRSKSREKDIALVRHITMYLMKKYTHKSLQEIAYFLKRKDHSTVIHAFKQIEQRMEENKTFNQEILHIERQLCQ